MASWVEQFDTVCAERMRDLKVLCDEPMRTHTTFRIGGPARRMACPASVQELSDLSPFVLKEISNFFANYKVLQGVTVEVGDYHPKADAIEIIRQCREKYENA